MMIWWYDDKTNLLNIQKQNELKSNLIESKWIFHSDTDAAAAGAAAGAAAASAAATVATTMKMVVKMKAAAEAAAAQAAAPAAAAAASFVSEWKINFDSIKFDFNWFCFFEYFWS